MKVQERSTVPFFIWMVYFERLSSLFLNPKSVRQFGKMAESSKGIKRSSSPSSEKLSKSNKLRDSLGFKIRRQVIDKSNLTAYDQLGGEKAQDRTNTLTKNKTIHEEETEGASYVIEGRLRRVTPYFFTYLTYCKLRWRDRKLLDIFTDEFRERDEEYYKNAIQEGLVAINKKPANLDSIVRNGDLISHRTHRHEPSVSSNPIKIVFEDENIIAIDKPSGIPVHPTGRFRYNTITNIFKHELGQVVHPCNRLDRLTSGLMFLGKTPKGADSFAQQIRDRTVSKEYVARVKGKFPLGEITVDEPLITISPKHTLNVIDRKLGKEAKTAFRRITYDPETDTSVVKCRPLTGRTHQIRVHLQFLGHPIANDPLYSSEYVWGKELGKGIHEDLSSVIGKLDTIGKSRASSSWIHPSPDGEVLTEEKCEVCDSPLYSDAGFNDLTLWLHAYQYKSNEKQWSFKTEYPEWALEPIRKFMKLALEKADLCGETQTQFNVGAVLVNEGEILETGHSRELPGNTHAEQCALEKYFNRTNQTDVPDGTEIFTTMEPCTLRLSGNLPCTDRILKTKIRTCFVGVMEPDIFVKNNSSYAKLTEGDVEYIHIPGYEEKALEIAKKGHENA